MRDDPRTQTPEAKAHAHECETIREKIATYVAGHAEDIHERDDRPALRVVPTFDQTGRVHMTIDQLAVCIGLPREELADPGERLRDQLGDDAS